jgi:hypothetical protein
MPQPGRGPTKPARRGPERRRHVPQRTCIVCRETDAKRALTRIVRTGDGVVEVDPTGRKNGRGAYLCDRRSCWDRALTTNVVATALRTTPSASSLEQLKEYAAGASLITSDQEPATDSKEQAL